MTQTIADSLLVQGGVQTQGPIQITVNDRGALNALDAYGQNLSLLNIDASGTIVEGPGYDYRNRYITYTPRGLEARELMWHGWNGVLTPGLNLVPIGNGYRTEWPGTGALRFLTGNGAYAVGDGVRMNFGNMFTNTVRRTHLYGMFNTEVNNSVDVQFGFESKTSSAAIRMRYNSAGGGASWTCTTDDGNGHVSTNIISDYQDATFRRQFQIRWYNGYSTGPSDVLFVFGDPNNEFRLKATHTYGMGSLPGANEKLYPYLQFRTNATDPRAFVFDHAYAWFER